MEIKIRTVFFALLGILLKTKLIASEAVSITKFEVPPHVQLHDNIVLTCEHDLKPGRLFQLQWFHKEEEFYRYATDQKYPKWAQEGSGLNVNISASSETQVAIANVNLTATGEFGCAVVTESPDYSEAKASANLTVVVIPTTKPVIEPPPSEGLRPGSMVDLNCTSAPSIPAATLEWHLNDKPVPPSYLRRHLPELQRDGLYVSRLGLNFKLERKNYDQGELKLRCTAKIATFYTKSDQQEHSHPTTLNSKTGKESPAQAVGAGRLNANGGTSLSLWCGYWIFMMVLGLAPR